jgi:DNA-binding NarL/FixJ family response regulator
MKSTPNLILVSHDTGLIEHWQRAFQPEKTTTAHRFSELIQDNPRPDTLAWIDLSMPDLPPWPDAQWRHIIQSQQVRVIATSTNPKDSAAIAALDAGCAAYCHGFSNSETLAQVTQVVQAGHVWIGKALMQRLIQSAGLAAPLNKETTADWGVGLTQREREIAIQAANGASNQAIAMECKISERTVKAHLSAVFEKFNITDRLQLALRVHGIH